MAAEFEIRLHNVMMYANHGVLPEERVLGNQYRICIRLRISADGFEEDCEDLSQTISYAEVYQILEQVMRQPCALLETVSVRFAKRALNRWPNIKSGEIEIFKVVPPIPGMIGEAGISYAF